MGMRAKQKNRRRPLVSFTISNKADALISVMAEGSSRSQVVEDAVVDMAKKRGLVVEAPGDDNMPG